MSDNRIAEELSIEELEEVIALRKREMRHVTQHRPYRRRDTTWRDRFLLLIEVSVLLGVVLAVISS